jgi:hypothetical protein
LNIFFAHCEISLTNGRGSLPPPAKDLGRVRLRDVMAGFAS